MQDLNATIFFKAKFHIYATSGENDDLLWKLILDIRSWITKKLNRPGCHPVIESSLHKWTFFKKGGKFYDLEPLNRVYAESVFHQAEDEPSKISWACKIVEKPEVESGYAPREWITEIGYQADTNTSAEIVTPDIIGLLLHILLKNTVKKKSSIFFVEHWHKMSIFMKVFSE